MQYFHPATWAWFGSAFAAATEVQREGWGHIAAGEHTLLLAPTGSGKTLAAFLAALDALIRPPEAAAAPPAGPRVLYISPLKALAYDIERNLQAPLAGIARHAEGLGLAVRRPLVALRTGDTPASERRRLATHPPDILVTTPESLYLMLGSRVGATLADVATVIVDEVHALAGSKRGAHLSLSLERLAERTAPRDPQRIGLSATVRPASEVARWLGGQRPVAVVDRSLPPRLELTVSPAGEGQARAAAKPVLASGPLLSLAAERPQVGDGEAARAAAALVSRLAALIEGHRATIVFVGSRAASERLAQELNDLHGSPWVRAHHGSLALKQRTDTEEALKSGILRGIVATSSLELGIDMGAVDLVVLVSSPGSVARGLQRIGRAGHGVGEVSRGVILTRSPTDLLECAALADGMRQAILEPLTVPMLALDVLAQQLVAQVVAEPATPAALGAWARRAYGYHALSEEMLRAVLEMLAGTTFHEELAELRPLLAWDRTENRLTARRGTRLTAVAQAGTIPDRGLFAVYLVGGGPRLGELDEEMVHESRRGDVFSLGTSSWRVEEIGRDRVLVSPAPGEPGKAPFWRGDSPGRPPSLGAAMGQLVRRLGGLERDQGLLLLAQRHSCDPAAAASLLDTLARQRAHSQVVPDDRQLVVERFRDEIGDWRLCLLSPWGLRVHAPWALAVEARLAAQRGVRPHITYNDDGIVVGLGDGEQGPGAEVFALDPDTVEQEVTAALADSALFAGAFRENAARALLMPAGAPGRRTPLWQQRLRGKMLLAQVSRSPSFPIVLETYRHCLRDVFDVPALVRVLAGIGRGELAVTEVEAATPSPFARSLSSAYASQFLYAGDLPAAERRAQALTIDRGLLQELLGDADLRRLLDAEVIAEVEAELQALAPGHRARDADELLDLLRRLGDLGEAEIDLRCEGDAAGARRALQRSGTAGPVRIAGARRWIAYQDAGRLRDALGVVPPAGLPAAFLAGDDEALAWLVRRFARRRGPFALAALASRYRLGAASLLPVLAALVRDGTLIAGALSPAGDDTEYCDAEVMRRIKRATLKKVRGQVAAVPASAWTQFLTRWHRLDAPRPGLEALKVALVRLEGLALPWSTWCQQVLPARVREFHPDMLDMLAATGFLVWVGCGAMGARDGRVRLLRRQQAALLGPLLPAPAAAPSAAGDAIVRALAERGASFTFELAEAAGLRTQAALEQALWPLVWAGQVTNDTVQPLRSLAGPRRRGTRGPAVVGGRWSLVGRGPAGDTTASRHGWVQVLLERWGILGREAVRWEELPGGFAAAYPILQAMETAGQVRQGYFVEGLGGAQFARLPAVEMLRGCTGSQGRRGPEAGPLAAWAGDPASPFGSILPWPERQPASMRPPRRQGTWAVLLDGGEALAAVDVKGRQMVTFNALSRAEAPGPALREALAHLAGQCRPRVVRIGRIDEEPVYRSRLAAALIAAGVGQSPDGLVVEPG